MGSGSSKQFAAAPPPELDSKTNTPYRVALLDKFPEVCTKLEAYGREITKFKMIAHETANLYKKTAKSYRGFSNIKKEQTE